MSDIQKNDFKNIPVILQVLSKYFIWFIVSLLLIVILFSFTSYGITWDEYVQNNYGNYVLNYYLSGFKDLRALNYRNLIFYGPGFELFASIFTRFFPKYPFEVRHLIIALSGLLTVIAVWYYTKQMKGVILQVLAPVILIMLPRFYGHMFNNSKDIPFACLFALSMVAIAHLLSKEKLTWINVLFCGFAIGITLSIRIGGLLLYVFLIVTLILRYTAMFIIERQSASHSCFKREIVDTVVKLCSIIFLSWFIMVILWPAALLHPFSHPIDSFMVAKKFPQFYPVRFNGRLILNNKLPFYYLHKYFLITTPVFILLMLPFGIINLIKKCFSKEIKDITTSILLLLWLFFPVLYVTVANPPLYDGIRHFMFLFPAIAIISAVGIEHLLSYIKNIRLYLYLLILGFILILLPLKDMIKLHPYQMTYFNAISGGVNANYKKYETDYWTASYKEAIEWINRWAEKNTEKKIVVIVAASSNNFLCAKYYASPQLKLYRVWTGKEFIPNQFFFFVGTTRDNMDSAFSYLPVIHRIGRDKAYFSVIKVNIPSK